MEPYNNTNILQFKVCTKDWRSDNMNIRLHRTSLQSADKQQKAWCIWQQIPACRAGLAQSWKLMFPSGAQPPSHVPQCLTEVSAAWARRGPSAGPWPPLITVCVLWREDCNRSAVRLQQYAAEWERRISWHLHSKLNIVVIYVKYSADPQSWTTDSLERYQMIIHSWLVPTENVHF